MSAYDHKQRVELEICPKCKMDSGERKCSVNLPERYYVRCYRCGFTVSGATQSAATNKWNTASREAQR